MIHRAGVFVVGRVTDSQYVLCGHFPSKDRNACRNHDRDKNYPKTRTQVQLLYEHKKFSMHEVFLLLERVCLGENFSSK